MHHGVIFRVMEKISKAPDAAILRKTLKQLPEPQIHPALVVVSGLPGTGKSYFCRQLASRFPMVTLESDALRKALFPALSYNEEESIRLFKAIHEIIAELLSRGISVALDATNLEEKNREKLYSIAEKARAKLVMVRVEASPELIKQRLEERNKSLKRLDSSEADWSVYERMQPVSQKIGRPHFVVDTSGDITPSLEKVLRELRR